MQETTNTSSSAAQTPLHPSKIFFDNIKEMDAALPDDQSCSRYFEWVRWNDKPLCPHCGSKKKPYSLKQRRYHNEYKCSDKGCYKKFNCVSNSIFQYAKIGMKDFFKAFVLICADTITPAKLKINIGHHVKTNRFINHRIRAAFANKRVSELSGLIQSDEAACGGRNFNRHVNKKYQSVQGKSMKDKTPIMGLWSSRKKIILEVLENVTSEELLARFDKYVKPGSIVFTDENRAYADLASKGYKHSKVQHSNKEFAAGGVNTNNIENVWSIIKPKIFGTHKNNLRNSGYLQQYCYEFEFRYNFKDAMFQQKLNIALKGSCNTFLTYKMLQRVRKVPADPRVFISYDEIIANNKEFQDFWNRSN